MFFVVRSAFWLGMVFTAMEWPGDGQIVRDLRDSAAPMANQAAQATLTRVEKTCVQAMKDCIDGAARINRLAGDLADQTSAGKGAPASIDTLLAADLEPEWGIAPKFVASVTNPKQGVSVPIPPTRPLTLAKVQLTQKPQAR